MTSENLPRRRAVRPALEVIMMSGEGYVMAINLVWCIVVCREGAMVN